MSFKYSWKNNEANFGPTISDEVSDGTHFAAECFLKFNGQYIAFRRPKAIPEHEIPEKARESRKPCLYNVHGLPRWGETTKQFIERIIKDQTGVNVKSFKVVDLTMDVYEKTKQWFIEPTLFVEVDCLPISGVYGNEITEIVVYDKDNVPNDFGWWSKENIERFLKEYDV